MKRLLACLLPLVLLAACGKTPRSAFERLEKAAREGDAKAFAAGFTEESEPFARALLAVYRTQAAAGGPATKPLEMLASATVVDETFESDRIAYLTVKTGEAKSILVFVRDGKGDWKLDIQLTEHDKRNARD